MSEPEQLELEKENQQLRGVIAQLEERLRKRETEVQLSKHSEAELRESFLLIKKYSTTPPYVCS